MAIIRTTTLMEAPALAGQSFRAEVINRQLTLTSNIIHCVAFLLTDAVDTANQEKVFYDRSVTDVFQSTVGYGQAGCIIVDPDNAYADASSVPSKINVELTTSDSSNANTTTQTCFRVRREVPHFFSTLDWITGISTATPNRLLAKVKVRNNNSSGVGSVKVALVLFG